MNSWFLVALVASRDAAVLALAVGGSLLLLGKRLAPGCRDALWLLVAARLIIPVLPSSPVSWQRWVPEPVLETTAPATLVTAEKTEAMTPDSRPIFAIPASPLPKMIETGQTQVLTKSNQAGPASILKSPAPTPSLSWRSWLAIGWAAGTIAFLTIIAAVTVRFRRRTRGLTIDSARLPEIRSLLAGIAREHGFRRTPRLRVTEAVSSPALTGLFRPEILLPPTVANHLSSGELRLILLHELGHFRRRDVWTNWVLSLLQAIHWFNPLVWWAFRRTRIEAERACDAWVLQRAGRAASGDYGQALIRLLKSTSKKPAVPGVVGVIESRRDLRRRIVLIGRFTGKRSRLAVIGAAALLAGLAAVGLTQAPAEKADAKEEETKKVVEGPLTTNGKPADGWNLVLNAPIPGQTDQDDWGSFPVTDWWSFTVKTGDDGTFRTDQLVPLDQPYRISFTDPITGKKSAERIGEVMAETGKLHRAAVDYDPKSRINVRGRFVVPRRQTRRRNPRACLRWRRPPPERQGDGRDRRRRPLHASAAPADDIFFVGGTSGGGR